VLLPRWSIVSKKMTITWHVDDLKISHMDKEVAGEVVEWFKSIYGNVRVSRGYHHDYLGMDIDFSYHKQLTVSMVNNLKRMIAEFPEARGYHIKCCYTSNR